MPFQVYSSTGNEPIGFIDNETEYTWTDMFDGTGSFTITMPNTQANAQIAQTNRLIRNVETDTLKFIQSMIVNADSITIAGKDAIFVQQSEYTVPERSESNRKVSTLLSTLLPPFFDFIPGNYTEMLNIAIPCLAKSSAILLVLSASGFGVTQGIAKKPFVRLEKYSQNPVCTFSTQDGSISEWELSKTVNGVCRRGVAYGSFGGDLIEFREYPEGSVAYPEIAADIGTVQGENPETDYPKFISKLMQTARNVYEENQTTGDQTEYTVNALYKPYMVGQYAAFNIPEIGQKEVRRIDGREISVMDGSREEKIIVGKLFRQK